MRFTATILGVLFHASVSHAAIRVEIITDAPLPKPAELALKDVEKAFKDRGVETARQAQIRDDRTSFVVGIAGKSKLVDDLIAREKIELPTAAESFVVRAAPAGKASVMLIAGRDARGLSYALLDAARTIALPPVEIKNGEYTIRDTIESPFLAVRAISVHLFNADLEAGWYFEEDYWREYFAMLALHRFNRFTLTFCDQTNYLCPLYSNLLEVPGYANVRVKGVTDLDRLRQLIMLKKISDLAAERGLDFTLGIWQQVPVPAYPPQVEVEGLPEGVKAAEYCAAGLKAVLKACPAIRGVQLRMNSEAGVKEADQTAFYRPIFHAIRDCGRPVFVELRYKGLVPETTNTALDAGLDVAVSTKYWAEHFGLPYHATVVDKNYRHDRYGFGNVLDHGRKYKVIFQHWTGGSQRITLWGDPNYTAKFARSIKAVGGEGFEVFAPLTNRGYGNASGKWELYPDIDGMKPHGRLFERYWFFTLAFGRLGFNPETVPEVWKRELLHQYGSAAGELEAAYRVMSRILPLITSARMPSASEWSWWPEMDTGDRLAEYSRTPSGDMGQFYAIRSWSRTPKWRADAWDTSVPGYVDDAVAGKLRGKWTPFDVSRALRELAMGEAVRDKNYHLTHSPEVLKTQLDFAQLAQIATYHAEKTEAATHLAFFEATGETGRLVAAREHMHKAEVAWELLSGRGKLYAPDLNFGTSPQNTRSKVGHHHSGTWKDRMHEIEEDVAYIEALIKKHGGENKPYRKFPGEVASFELPKVEHTAAKVADPAKDLTIAASVSAKSPIARVVLHHRPLNQHADWKEVTMTKTADGKFEAVISHKDITSQFDLQYYLEVLYVSGGGRMWPSWQDGMPYFIVSTRKPLAASR